jgi:signal peptidase II
MSNKIAPLPLLAFAMVAAGGIGNLIDRIFREGRVVDFMNMGITLKQFSIRTGIFNVADLAIMAGLFMIILNEAMVLRRGKKEGREAVSQKKKKRS